MAAAVKNDLVKGMGDGVFGIGQAITRQDLATIIWNGVQNLVPANDGKAFADDSSIADYAKVSVSRLRAAGIIDGMENNSFMPTKNATRAEAAKLLYMTLQAIN